MSASPLRRALKLAQEWQDRAEMAEAKAEEYSVRADQMAAEIEALREQLDASRRATE